MKQNDVASIADAKTASEGVFIDENSLHSTDVTITDAWRGKETLRKKDPDPSLLEGLQLRPKSQRNSYFKRIANAKPPQDLPEFEEQLYMLRRREKPEPERKSESKPESECDLSTCDPNKRHQSFGVFAIYEHEYF